MKEPNRSIGHGENIDTKGIDLEPNDGEKEKLGVSINFNLYLSNKAEG
ncbi:MAG: hypothetical protein AAB647_03455 [Patescibacteria group bacterium]